MPKHVPNLKCRQLKCVTNYQAPTLCCCTQIDQHGPTHCHCFLLHIFLFSLFLSPVFGWGFCDLSFCDQEHIGSVLTSFSFTQSSGGQMTFLSLLRQVSDQRTWVPGKVLISQVRSGGMRRLCLGGGCHFTEEHDRLSCLCLQTVFQPVLISE